MKKIHLFLLLLIAALKSTAQTDTADVQYKRDQIFSTLNPSFITTGLLKDKSFNIARSDLMKGNGVFDQTRS